jgi:hypothetical protein
MPAVSEAPPCFTCGIRAGCGADIVVAPVEIIANGGRLLVGLCELCLHEAKRRAREWERRQAA